tara:strand:+ start:419 stop:676 length:258 start_codon:yes stop_codon:yes gene_type:complete
MKIGKINFKKIPKVQYYVLILGLFTTTAWWMRTVFILDDNEDSEPDIMNTKITKKQYYALLISLVLSVIGWIETVFLFNSIKCGK